MEALDIKKQFSHLSDIGNVYQIHIGVGVVLAGHPPDKGVVAGSAARVDRPGGRDDALAVGDQEVARFLGLAHEVEHALSFGDVEIKIGFHSAKMRMGGHGIPDASCFEYGETHDQLAAADPFCMDVFIDRPVIGGLCRACGDGEGIFFCEELYGMGGMRGGRQQEEKRWFVGMFAFEFDLLYSFAGIEAIQFVQVLGDAVCVYSTLSADVDDAEFASLE